MIKYFCPKCNAKLGAEDYAAGTTVQCPDCMKEHKVPPKSTRTSSGDKEGKVGNVPEEIVTAKTTDALGQSRLGMDSDRVLASKLGVRVLRTDICADLYAQNGFRFIGIPACSDKNALEAAAQQMRNACRLSPRAGQKSAIQLGYDEHWEFENPLDFVSRLRDPGQRIVCELFWPHLDGVFEHIKRQRRLGVADAVAALEPLAQQNNGRESILAAHSLAVIYHNEALAGELRFALRRAEWPRQHWVKALQYWAQVIASNEFWSYIEERIRGYDDIRVRAADIEMLRRQLPEAVMAFNVLFARLYARARAAGPSNSHLSVVSESHFEESAKEASIVSCLRQMTNGQLDPLIRRAKDASEDLAEDAAKTNGEAKPAAKEKGAKPERLSRDEFHKVYGRILDQARAVQRYLTEEIKLSKHLVSLAEFDQLVDAVQQALSNRLDYSGDHRVRNLLYSMLTVKQLLELPLSAGAHRRLEQALRDDKKALYGDFDSQELDPATCWFLAGEDADPDASVVVSVYKIVRVQGISVQWQTRQILIPRSKIVREIHGGGAVGAAKLTELRQGPKWKAIQEEIAGIRADCERAVKDAEQKSGINIQARRAEYEKRRAMFDAKVADQERSDRALLAGMELRLEQAIGEENGRQDEVWSLREKKYEPARIQIRNDRQTAIDAFGGLRSWHALELPAAFLGTAVHGFLGGALSFVLPAGGGVGPVATMAMAGSGIGLIVGVSMAQFGRRYASRQVARRSVAIEEAVAEDKARNDLARQAALKALRGQHEKDASTIKGRLDTLDGDRAAMQKHYEKEKADIESDTQARIKSLRAATNAKMAPLEAKLNAGAKPRPEKAKDEYPAYVKAQSQGFVDGLKPSDSEINRIVTREIENFKNSLTYSEQQILGLMAQRMGQQQFGEFMVTLMSMPISDRKAALSNPLAMLGLLR